MRFFTPTLLLVVGLCHCLGEAASANDSTSDLVLYSVSDCSGDNPFLRMTLCADKKQCVPMSNICDAKDDCSDGSDETASACRQVHSKVCPEVTTSGGAEFQCKYGGSVAKDRVCDGTPDCRDGSDEVECKRCHCKSSSRGSGYFQCEYGACIDREQRCDGRRDCPDGSDESGCDRFSDLPPSSSKKSCQLPRHPDHGENTIICDKGKRKCIEKSGETVTHGTLLVTECQPKFQLTSGDGYSMCDNGVWRPRQHTCTECGVSMKQFNTNEEALLIWNGDNATLGDFPWMSGLYQRNAADSWDQICGGTLISSHIVLTAAHCVVKSDGTKTRPDNIRVALGKLHRDYYHKEDSTLIANVREVVVPQRYVGFTSNYDMDIALLDLDISVRSSPNIMPACLDLRGSFKLRHGLTGYLAGWGKNEHDKPSVQLQWARQKYVDYESCKGKISPTNIRFITHDKFCVESVHGSRSDKGDSGGGLTFTKHKIHFVFGIVSTSPRGESLVMFTNVANGEHREWLRDNWRRLNKYHN